MIPIKDNNSEEKILNEETEPQEVKTEEVETEEVKTEETNETESAPEEVQEASQEEEEAPKKESRKEKKKKENEKLAEKEEEIKLLNDKYLRLCAEYDNYRKRTQKEKDNRFTDGKEFVITNLLPVYDNLVRALEQKTEDEAYYKGVELIMNQFNATFEKLGVTEIPALGEEFNPELHNAVMHVDDEEKGKNEIVEVFQKGFKLGDKVIRFPMVKVAN